jgi:hypothetical protein
MFVVTFGEHETITPIKTPIIIVCLIGEYIKV